MKIKSLKRIAYSGKVYNFHCVPSENYFSENILVHNCYKANTPDGTYMSYETFTRIFDLVNESRTLTQIAFGVDARAESNPDMLAIMEYSRRHGVIPNVTVANISPEKAKDLASVCGAVSVSRYQDKEQCYNSIQYLHDAGLKYINIHCMLSEETVGLVLETFQDYLSDPRLKYITAIILLSLKQKGRGVGYHPVPQISFTQLYQEALENDIPLGFDSCTYHKMVQASKDLSIPQKEIEELQIVADPCESGLMSLYADVNGTVFPCSFMESADEWDEGISLLKAKNFLTDVWKHPKMELWRKNLLGNDRRCPVYIV